MTDTLPTLTDLTGSTDRTGPAGPPDPVVLTDLGDALRAACRRIAPLWPLERFVAVNPYLGLTDLRFDEAAEVLAARGGARHTLPIAWYLDLVDEGRIGHDDLAAALAGPAGTGLPADPAAFLARARAEGPDGDAAAAEVRVPTVADVATHVTGQDWVRFTTHRVSDWAAAYFDGGQALWRSADPHARPYAAWRAEAEVDRTPEVMGLRGVRATVRSLPADPIAASEAALAELGVPGPGLEAYLHRLLLRVGGWAAHAARLVWESDLAAANSDDDSSGGDDTVVELLAVLLTWEVATLRALEAAGVTDAWRAAAVGLGALPQRPEVREPLALRLVLQDAFDHAEQRRLVAAFAGVASGAVPAAPATPPAVQAVFCIDVRSEVFRRHLESVAPEVATMGFAGFFGFPVEVLPLAHDHGEAQCPVLLTPSHSLAETATDVDGSDRTVDAAEARRLTHQVRRAWKSFKMGAISCFSFVGPVGLVYLPKLFTDASGRTRPVRRAEVEGLPAWARGHTGPSLASGAPFGLDVAGIPAADRVAMAEGALRAMSLTDGFAPLVLIAGHGASTVNNPYDTGLDCGACGGHTGEANSRVAAAVLNDPEVRTGLAQRGIHVPEATWFVAAQHDTTTDEVTVFDRASVPAAFGADLAALEARLAAAGDGARAERAQRMGTDAASVARRATDWAQVRPEWGLAGCRAFVVAPRERTQDLDLGGRSFLHSYDWRADEGFGVLELVMTAPMVVASWISLQYYGSTVENRLFGSGDKTLHNVVGKLGVLEGNAGDLRTGLPWQSVHDGEAYQHEPLRLNVVIEAPIEAMTDVLARHDGVRALVDHGWLHLLALGDDGRVSHRYAGDLTWEALG